MSNYQLMSKLTFLAKVIETVVYQQIHSEQSPQCLDSDDSADTALITVLFSVIVMQRNVGLSALNWFEFYLTNSDFFVILQTYFRPNKGHVWVPQGSVVGLLPFNIYTLSLTQIMEHSYAHCWEGYF